MVLATDGLNNMTCPTCQGTTRSDIRLGLAPMEARCKQCIYTTCLEHGWESRNSAEREPRATFHGEAHCGAKNGAGHGTVPSAISLITVWTAQQLPCDKCQARLSSDHIQRSTGFVELMTDCTYSTVSAIISFTITDKADKVLRPWTRMVRRG